MARCCAPWLALHTTGSRLTWLAPGGPRSGGRYASRQARQRCLRRQLDSTRRAALAVDTLETATANQEESESFKWTKYWWPLIPVDYLDPKKPKAMTILGVQVAVWKDGEGQWRVFKDACPHRLAPLSEGRVEADGTLLCSYHAWRFNGEGKCTSIPQSISSEAEATATASKRSCAVAFPTQEHVGLVWVWPDESDTRWIEAAAAPMPIHKKLEDDYDRDPKDIMWVMRDLPYGYEILAENLTDPAHFPISHHALFPGVSRYSLNRMAFQPDPEDPSVKPWMNAPVPTIAKFRHTTAWGSMPDRTVHLLPPTTFLLGDSRNDPEAGSLITSLCVPVSPGRSRLVYCDTFIPRRLLPPAKTGLDKLRNILLGVLISLRFTAASKHVGMLRLLDGDSVFLNIQETTLRERYKNSWKDAFFLPTPSDSATVALRTWIDEVGRPFADQEKQAASPAGPIDRKALLDRYTQHTAHCPTCQKEVKRLEGLISAAKVTAAVGLLAACVVAGSVGWAGLVQDSFPFLTKPGSVVLLLAGLAAWAANTLVSKLQAARQEFFFVDYVHADKH